MSEFKRGWKGRVRVHLNDEAPRLGSGVRWLDAHVGNRRVTLTNPATGRTAKLSRQVFEALHPEVSR
jgi:hypothetical protein